MPIGANAPIQLEDITTDEEFVRLHREKFSALINYNEHIEQSLKFLEFDYWSERNFSQLLLSAFATVCKAVVECVHTNNANDEDDSRLNELKQSLEDELKSCRQAFSEGSINDYHKDKLHSILVEVLSKVGANREQG